MMALSTPQISVVLERNSQKFFLLMFVLFFLFVLFFILTDIK